MNQPPFTKSEWVYTEIRNRIASGALAPGDRLRLTAIAREFNVSEMPVREALRMLGRDRLVAMESHRGAIVVDLSLERTVEIIVVRTHLEMLAFEEAAGRHSESDFEALDEVTKKMDRAADRGDGKRYSELNRSFHRLLYAPGRNQTLKTEIEGLWDRLWSTRDRSIFAMRPERMKEAQAEHLAIFRMLKAGKIAQAKKTINAHREATLEAWNSILAEHRARHETSGQKEAVK